MPCIPCAHHPNHPQPWWQANLFEHHVLAVCQCSPEKNRWALLANIANRPQPAWSLVISRTSIWIQWSSTKASFEVSKSQSNFDSCAKEEIRLGHLWLLRWKSYRHCFDVWIRFRVGLFFYTPWFFPSNQPFQKRWTETWETSETDQDSWETGRHPVIEWLTATSSCIQTGKLLLPGRQMVQCKRNKWFQLKVPKIKNYDQFTQDTSISLGDCSPFLPPVWLVVSRSCKERSISRSSNFPFSFKSNSIYTNILRVYSK